MNRLVIIIALAAGFASCKSKEQEIKPVFRELTSAVYASGSLVSGTDYKVISSVDGYLSELLVKEGDTVTTGQLLFVVSNQVRTAKEATARSLVQETYPTIGPNSPALRELRGQLQLARIQVSQDSLTYERYKKLYEANAVSAVNYEKYSLQYQSTLKDYQNLKERIQQEELSGNLQLRQAQNQLQVAAAEANTGRVKSFVNGVVYDIYKNVGDLVSSNQAVALIGSGPMMAQLQVDEDDLEKVYVGQKVMISMDAFPNKVFEAIIQKVYPYLDPVAQSFRVDASFKTPVPANTYGLNLEANIITAEKKRVLALPRTAIQKGDTVWVKTEGKDARPVRITRGIADDQWVEIKSGITEQSVVIVKP